MNGMDVAGDVAVDSVGRMVVPIKARRALGIQGQTDLKAYIDMKGGAVVLKVAKRCCLACGSTENLKSYQNIVLCDRCLTELQKNG